MWIADSPEWECVRRSFLRPVVESTPQVASGPVRLGDHVLFRFRAPKGTVAVYLAGGFNGWAGNSNGKVTNRRYSMTSGPNGEFTRWEQLGPGEWSYKFVHQDRSGKQTWISDPALDDLDSDGNSRLRFESIADSFVAPPTSLLTPRRPSRPRPAETFLLPRARYSPGAKLAVGGQVLEPTGRVLQSGPALTAPKAPGGYRVLDGAGREAILSVATDPAQDLRYGFYTSYQTLGANYGKKAEMLRGAHLNAVEYYDYFPAHGRYVPPREVYQFEPFGVTINGLDVHSKIESARSMGILNLAYVAAYAASESVYRAHPHPMTDERGVPKVFNGRILPEDQADPKWFWLMDVGPGSAWRNHVLQEFRGALNYFDGFALDTYGDQDDTKFFAPKSPANGQLLKDVLGGFVAEVGRVSRRTKPGAILCFNSVNEFGIGSMATVTDFLFLELWRGHSPRLADLVDIGSFHRDRDGQRVILKLYPADMEPAQKFWPAQTLRRVMGAALLGGASLMAAGEPDETKGQMHGLQSLYYPDHQPMPAETFEVLRAYNRHDALLYGLTHGAEVQNSDWAPRIPEFLSTARVSPMRRTVAIQLLRTGPEPRWYRSVESPPLGDRVFRFDLPPGVQPKEVFYASPDHAETANFRTCRFRIAEGTLEVAVPKFHTYGTLILQF